ncbi:hypothetical protein NTE_00701 [Candidatus Nitrososphaera evergladensis SR1]|uniref:Uncharacterized protein n=1 Tax=Candidatus Nitrososphaera evergladensis SR1 TaxID=1459636 RepID=A0A075MMW2_9ARCH|nr:hypothetical protein NTE_00701 [Candidatus Nitrososphaera evergladensis SR1]
MFCKGVHFRNREPCSSALDLYLLSLVDLVIYYDRRRSKGDQKRDLPEICGVLKWELNSRILLRWLCYSDLHMLAKKASLRRPKFFLFIREFLTRRTFTFGMDGMARNSSYPIMLSAIYPALTLYTVIHGMLKCLRFMLPLPFNRHGRGYNNYPLITALKAFFIWYFCRSALWPSSVYV